MAIPSGIVIGWPSTAGTIPTGWDRVTALDGKHPKQIPNSSTDPGSIGGNAQHHHTTADHQHTLSHTHVTGGSTAAASGTVTHSSVSGTDSQTGTTHTHTVGVVAASADSTPTDANSHPNSEDIDLDPARWDTIYIQSDGTPTSIPEGAITWFSDATLPPSWTQPANGKDKFLRGAAASGDGGATGGGAAHTHAGGSHAHASTHGHPSGTTGAGGNVQNNANPLNTGVAAFDNHTHPYDVVSNNFGSSQSGNLATSGSATAAAAEPPWIKLAHITPPAGGDALQSGLIAIWLDILDNIPLHWVLCDGNNGTPNLCQGLFTKGANLLTELLTTGGNANHTHTGANHTHTWTSSAHTHTITVNATPTTGGTTGTAGTGITASSPTHTHSVTTSSAAGTLTVGNAAPALIASTDNNPAYVEAAYIQYQPPVDYPLTLDADSFTLAGKVLELRIDFSPGAFSLSGQAIEFDKPRTSLTHFSGHNIALPSRIYGTFARVAADYPLTLAGDTFSLSGNNLELRIEPQAGAFSLSGQDAELGYSPHRTVTHFANHGTLGLPSRVYGTFSKSAAYTLDLDANEFTLAGQANILSQQVSLLSDAFSLSGQTGSFSQEKNLDSNGFAITGQLADLAKPFILDANDFTVGGQDITLTYVRVLSLNLDVGDFTLTGQVLAESQLEDLAAENYSITGPDALLTKANVYDLTLEAASYSVSGQLTVNSLNISILAASYASAGQTLAESQLKDFASGSLSVVGQITTLVKISLSEMVLEVGDYMLSGQATVNDQQRNLIGSSYAYAGQTLAQSQLEDLASANYALSGGTLIKASTALLAPNVFFLNGNPSSKYIYAPLDSQAFSLSGQAITLNYVLGRDVSPLTERTSLGLPMRIHGTFGRITAAKTLTLDATSFALAGGALGGRPVSNFSIHGVMGLPSRIPGDFYKAKILQIALDPAAFALVTDGYYAILHDEVGNVITDPTTGLPIQVWVDTTTQLLTGTTTDHPLTLEARSFTLTGQVLTLSRVQSNTAGNYALTGQAAELPRPIVNLDGAQYALSGQPATIQKVFPTLTLAAASYAVSGQPELFERRNSNLAGSYALSGQPAIFSAWNLILASADFALVGDETSLQKIGQYGTDLTAGSYALAGQDAALNLDRIAEPGTYDYTGETANLDRLDLTLAAQAISLNGQDALIYKVGVYALDLDGYDFTLTGNDQDYLYSRFMFLGANGYVLISPDEQEGLSSRYLDLDESLYFYNGSNATLATAADFPLDADAGGYGLTGYDVDLLTLEKAISLSGGQYALTGGVATLLATVVKIKLTSRLASGTLRLRGKIQGGKVEKLRVKTSVDLKSDVFDSS